MGVRPTVCEYSKVLLGKLGDDGEVSYIEAGLKIFWLRLARRRKLGVGLTD